MLQSLSPSSSINQLVLRSLIPSSYVATVLHFAVCVYVDVQLQVGQTAACGKRRKAGHFWCWSLRRNELECTNLVHWTEELHRFSSRDAITVVGFVLEKHVDDDFTPDQEKDHFSNFGHRGTKRKT